MRPSLLLGPVVLASLLAGPALAQVPPAAEVDALLQKEPVSAATWPAWHDRLLSWIEDRSQSTTPAYLAAHEFVRGQVDAAGQLVAPLDGDALAWYFLGTSYLRDTKAGQPADTSASRAEAALRQSIKLDPAFARAHRNLAHALLLQSKGIPASAELAEAHRLAPGLPLKHVEAQVALQQKRLADAERLFRDAMAEEPTEPSYATGLAMAVCLNPNRPGSRADVVQPLVAKFPDDGALACLNGLALAFDDNPRAGAQEFDRARRLGADPSHLLSADVVAKIEEAGAPRWYETFGRLMFWFAIAYAAFMAIMALAGVILAGMTRGRKALELLGAPADELVSAGGQVRRVGGESALAKVYVAGLMLGLVLFYAAIPFVVIGLAGGTAGLLMLIFMANRIPVKLVIIILVVGLGCVWAVVKALFARPAAGGFGLKKDASECPRLFAVVTEVAGRVDTQPVDEIYLAPGSEIGVHQAGRGPFGLFGVKRRVLTLGLSTMHYLTVTELKAILAHEYAHFSHADTFVNRFVYQVSLTIGETLRGMANAGGNLNYVNPFYWFLVLYHKSYSLLSAGYSRSREFLADRMAASLYGSGPFRSGLAKVCTDGSLFEMTIYHNITGLLGQGKAFVNMYESFKNYRDEQMKAEERDELYQKLLTEKGSLFASHPTFGERVEALEALPPGPPQDETSARTLFEDPDAIERELTEFMTAYVAHIQQLQAQAAEAK
jgi:Zn-dependent protease with chaperone function